MPTWKVLLVGVLAFVCLGLASSAVIIPMGMTGGQAWGWFAALFTATLVVGTLFALFLRQAGNALLVKPRR